MVAKTTSENFALTTSLRSRTGKGHMRRLRAQGMVPCVFYRGNTAWPMQAPTREVTRILNTVGARTSLLTLQFEDEKKQAQTRKVLIKEVQKDPLGLRLLHVDFHEVNLKRPVRLWVNVLTKGRPVGEMLGGVLQKVMHQIEIECLPDGIPQEIEVDVTPLKIGFSLHVSDVIFAKGVRPISPSQETVFVVAAPRAQEEEASSSAVAGESVEEKDGQAEGNTLK